MNYLGKANGIRVYGWDDETLDVRVGYSTVVGLLIAGADTLAMLYLSSLEGA